MLTSGTATAAAAAAAAADDDDDDEDDEKHEVDDADGRSDFDSTCISVG
jgi:ribosomal protein L12E/L44/L45/RPP1/RPP2